MKIIGYNIVPICLLILAGFLAYNKLDYWGWCIVGAMFLAVVPSTKN